MATKTISIDLKAYQRLTRARARPDESFSQVIHRAEWNSAPKTCGGVLRAVRQNKVHLNPAEVRALERAQAQDRPPRLKSVS